jgi:monovalent cation:H+ antiporter-2, CPA2 family
MPQSDPLIIMVVGGFLAALGLGMLAHKLRLSPVLGYLAAGIVMSPHTPGFAADPELAVELADLGLILVMFGIGLKFSPARMGKFRWAVLPCALAQMLAVTLAGYGLAVLAGLPAAERLLFGFCLCLASAVVALRMLEDRHMMASSAGRLALCWLMVQGLCAVFVLVAVAAIGQHQASSGGGQSAVRIIGLKAAELAVFGAIMLIVARRILPGLLVLVARSKSRELFSLAVFATGLTVAAIAHAMLGAGFALGAFFAGLVLSETDLSHRAAEDLLPLRNAFSVLFFLAIGMLFDPRILASSPWTVAGMAALVVIGNCGAIFGLATLLRLPLGEKLLLAAGLAQIGEASFLISSFSHWVDLIGDDTHALIAAGAVVTILINPFLVHAAAFAARRGAAASGYKAPPNAGLATSD